jgi:hypothetical protein
MIESALCVCLGGGDRPSMIAPLLLTVVRSPNHSPQADHGQVSGGFLWRPPQGGAKPMAR